MTDFKRYFWISFLTALFLLLFVFGFLYLCCKGEDKTGTAAVFTAAVTKAQDLLYPEYSAKQVLALAGENTENGILQAVTRFFYAFLDEWTGCR